MKDSKSIEEYVKLLINNKPIDGDDKYIDASNKIYSHINGVLINTNKNENLNNTNYEVYKPKVFGNILNNKSEPKTDLVIKDNNTGEKISLSIKMDEGAYVVSCNSRVDFQKQLIDIHNGFLILSDYMIKRLYGSSSYIRKVPNFNSYDKGYQKNNKLDEFIEDKFIKKATRFVSREKAVEYGNFIKNCYNDDKLKQKYVKYLHESESYIQDTMMLLLTEYPEYSKKVIFEFVSGRKKFQGNECSCDYLVSSSGLYKLDSYECEYINILYNKFINNKKIGRLQNVPRKNIKKGTLLSEDLVTISEEFSVADLTFKI